MISILFLAADPKDTSRLRLGEELREIDEKLRLSKLRDSFVFHQRHSVRPADMSQALLDINPQIVHFSGHGTADGALCVEDMSGNMHPIQPDSLAALFEQFSPQVKCVILNACYAESQARAIGKHINCVIGTNQAISDKAAIAFSVGFYQALGAGRSIKDSYELGCVQVRLQGISEHLTPILILRDENTDILKIKSEQLDILSVLSDFLRLGGSDRMPKDELARQFRNRSIEKELDTLERTGYIKETIERFGGRAYTYLEITEKGQVLLRENS